MRFLLALALVPSALFAAPSWVRDIDVCANTLLQVHALAANSGSDREQLAALYPSRSQELDCNAPTGVYFPAETTERRVYLDDYKATTVIVPFTEMKLPGLKSPALVAVNPHVPQTREEVLGGAFGLKDTQAVILSGATDIRLFLRKVRGNSPETAGLENAREQIEGDSTRRRHKDEVAVAMTVFTSLVGGIGGYALGYFVFHEGVFNQHAIGLLGGSVYFIGGAVIGAPLAQGFATSYGFAPGQAIEYVPAKRSFVVFRQVVTEMLEGKRPPEVVHLALRTWDDQGRADFRFVPGETPTLEVITYQQPGEARRFNTYDLDGYPVIP